jgi:hypothetical protein
MQKARLYGYVDHATIQAIEDSQYTKSGFVREAVQEKLEREGLSNE